MLCVIGKIDSAATERLNVLADTVKEFHLPPRPVYGHITLVSYLGGDEAEFVRRCKAALRDQASISVRYDRVSSLPPTPSIVVLPEWTSQLRQIHAKLIAAQASDLDIWSSPERWQPHTTLFYHTEAELSIILDRMRESFAPVTAEISQIEFSKVTDSGYQIIETFPLL